MEKEKGDLRKVTMNQEGAMRLSDQVIDMITDEHPHITNEVRKLMLKRRDAARSDCRRNS